MGGRTGLVTVSNATRLPVAERETERALGKQKGCIFLPLSDKSQYF